MDQKSIPPGESNINPAASKIILGRPRSLAWLGQRGRPNIYTGAPDNVGGACWRHRSQLLRNGLDWHPAPPRSHEKRLQQSRGGIQICRNRRTRRLGSSLSPSWQDQGRRSLSDRRCHRRRFNFSRRLVGHISFQPLPNFISPTSGDRSGRADVGMRSGQVRPVSSRAASRRRCCPQRVRFLCQHHILTIRYHFFRLRRSGQWRIEAERSASRPCSRSSFAPATAARSHTLG